MHPLEDAVDAKAHDTAFSGVVRVDRSASSSLRRRMGWPIAGPLEELTA
jgi:hypothetical protein